MLGGCVYGNADSETLLEYHLLCLIVTLCISTLLWSDFTLAKFYLPLSQMVNFSIVLQLISAIFYLFYYPYHSDESNCPEFFSSRLATVAIMLGELHQINLIANVLGIGLHKFNFHGRTSISLHAVLKIASWVVFLSMSVVFLYFGEATLIIENSWTLCVSLLQLYLIALARKLLRGRQFEGVVSPNSSAVQIFESLSTMQVMLAIVSLIGLGASDFLTPFLTSSSILTLIYTLDEVVTLLFYIKIIVVKENSNVVVEYVNTEQV
jgi:hypothetical protein